MNILCDENVQSWTVDLLVQSGHDVLSAEAAGLCGADDDAVSDCAIRTQRVLVTFNSDFSDVRRLAGSSIGIIRLRIHPQVPSVVLPVLRKAMAGLESMDLRGALVTVTRSKVRIRRR